VYLNIYKHRRGIWEDLHFGDVIVLIAEYYGTCMFFFVLLSIYHQSCNLESKSNPSAKVHQCLWASNASDFIVFCSCRYPHGFPRLGHICVRWVSSAVRLPFLATDPYGSTHLSYCFMYAYSYGHGPVTSYFCTYNPKKTECTIP